MNGSSQLVIFSVDGQLFALDLDSVERILRAVEITHLPDAPDLCLGVINVEGRVIPVMNTRRRLGLPERDIELDDLFIIVQKDGWSIALVADEVRPVIEVPEQQIVASTRILPGAGHVQGVAKLDEGMIMLLKVERLLPQDQHRVLHTAIGEIQE